MSKFKPKPTIVLTALVALALAAPAAQAQPIDANLPAATGVSAGLGAATPPSQPAAAPSQSGNGFDLGDAALGGAATLALVALGVGATQVARRTRHGHAATS